jgi:hypothetical protein
MRRFRALGVPLEANRAPSAAGDWLVSAIRMAKFASTRPRVAGRCWNWRLPWRDIRLSWPDLDSDSILFTMTTAILIVIYIFLLFASIGASYRLAPFDMNSGFGNFAKVATVAVAAVSALMTAVVTIINFDRNAKDAKNLAVLNARLQRRLARYNAKLSKTLVADKLGADISLERWKTTITKEMTAYSELWAAAQGAFYLVAKLESSKWEPADKDAVDTAMTKVSGSASYLATKEHGDLWTKIWNRTNYIAELAAKLPAKEDQPKLWHEQSGGLGDLMLQFHQIVAEQIHRTS